ncbi:MAG: 3'-5' exonuclease [Pseudomonadota bacterium]
MTITAEDALAALLATFPLPTVQAPDNARGLYGLVDHRGDLRYIGSTRSSDQSFHERIHQRHRTGSEGMSHYFSHMYNVGRMWRDRKDPMTKADGGLAKALRNEFVVDHCRAVWLALPDTMDIAQLEAEVIDLAPDQLKAWNRRGMQAYDEPVDQVDATLRRLGWGTREFAAVERQRLRFLAAKAGIVAMPASGPVSIRQSPVAPFPKGPFRFFALDVETANNDRGSICQIGVACVRPDNSIETWMTYVDPQVDRWVFTYLHGISARTVQGSPTFAEVLPVLRDALDGATVYQHSGFDRGAIAAACGHYGLPIPKWDWQDSVRIARAAWPELRGNGGHGLASLKQHLGLTFDHHDAGEDARAAAEVVLRAEGVQPARAQDWGQTSGISTLDDEDFDLIEDCEVRKAGVAKAAEVQHIQLASGPTVHRRSSVPIGTTVITQGNIDHDHIYLRGFFDRFPADVIGGSNRSSAARREIAVDWGGGTVVMTDLDGVKQLFRKRGWIREFFEQHAVRAGDEVAVEEVAPYHYRLRLVRQS